MTTPEPVDPAVPTPPVPEPTPEEAAAQQAAAERAAAEAALNEQIRALAAKIAEQAILDFDPATYRKGAVVSIQSTATPPTLTVTISGDTLEIPGVRYYDHYHPAVNDVVHLMKQGTDLTAAGKIADQYSATSWTLASLLTGFTHNGNAGGNVEYRKVWENGSAKVEFKGVAGRSSGTNIFALPAGYQPPALRPLIARRNESGGSLTVGLDIGSNVTMVGGTTSPAAVGTHLHDVGITDNEHTHQIANSDHFHGDTDAAGSHTHGIANNDHNHGSPTGTTSGHSHSIATTTHKHGNAADGEAGGTTSVNAHAHNIPVSSHTHGSNGALGTAVTINGATDSGGGHSHTVTDPTWISFNGVEVWL
jgi:hypothetical protein